MNVQFNRRDFLAISGLAASPMPAQAQPIIDSHTHFYDTGRRGGTPWPPKGDRVLYRPVLPPEYLNLTAKHGIVGTIEVEASPLVEDNQWILDLAEKYPIIIGTVGHLEPGTPDFQKQLARFQKNFRFRGIRIGTLWGKNVSSDLPAKQFTDDMKAVADAGLTVDLVGDGDKILAAILLLTDRIPNLRIVIDHVPFQRKEESALFPELRGRPDVFAKVSNVPRNVAGRVPVDAAFYKPALDEIYEIFGPDRVIYGSNWPVSDKVAPFEIALQIVREYFGGKGPEAAAKYFHDNAVRAYRLTRK